jgi:hypothetical protein
VNKIIDQAKFCEALCSRLTDRIELHESKRKHEWHAGIYDVSAEGAFKTTASAGCHHSSQRTEPVE